MQNITIYLITRFQKYAPAIALWWQTGTAFCIQTVTVFSARFQFRVNQVVYQASLSSKRHLNHTSQ